VNEKSLKLVTIATYELAFEAYLAKNVLESEGIRALVLDEHISSALWTDISLFGGVELQVNESDAERAIKILGEIRKIPPDEYFESEYAETYEEGGKGEPGKEDFEEDVEDGYEFEVEELSEEDETESLWKTNLDYQDMLLLFVILILIALLAGSW
jgi:hypothetical protein